MAPSWGPDMQFWIFIFALYSFPVNHCWQWCYVCSGVGEDRTCETSPLGVMHGPRAVNCTSPYCTAVKVSYRGEFCRVGVKVDYKDSNTTQSFARLCEAVDRGNWCVYDPNFITCYHTCSSHFCNDGNPDPEYLPEVNNADMQQKTMQAIDNRVDTLSEYGDIKPVPLENYHHLMEDARPHLTSLPVSSRAAIQNASPMPSYDIKDDVKKAEISRDDDTETKVSRPEFQSAEAETSSGNVISGSFLVIIGHVMSFGIGRLLMFF